MRLRTRRLLPTLSLSLALLAASHPAAGAPEGDASPSLLGAMASADITPEIGIPLGGFGGGARRLDPPDLANRFPFAFFLHPSEGQLDPIRAKALVLARGGRHLVFVSLDLIGTSLHLREDLLKRVRGLGILDGELMMSGTHTHSGPGTLSQELFWELLAMDLFQREVYEKLLDRVASTIELALRRLEPVKLWSYSFQAEGLQANRRLPGGPVDSEGHVLLLQAEDGQWAGAMTGLGIHGTALSDRNFFYSADVPGGIERELARRLTALNRLFRGSEGRQAEAMFVNGAEGDVAPARLGVAGIQAIARDFADQAMAALSGARALPGEWSARHADIDLGPASIEARPCRFDPSLGAFRVRSENGKGKVSVIRIGDLTLLAWPGEPTVSLGLRSKELARKAGAFQAWVLSLTNAHLAYFTTPEEHEMGGYEACMTLYGAQAGNKINSALAGLLGI